MTENQNHIIGNSDFTGGSEMVTKPLSYFGRFLKELFSKNFTLYSKKSKTIVLFHKNPKKRFFDDIKIRSKFVLVKRNPINFFFKESEFFIYFWRKCFLQKSTKIGQRFGHHIGAPGKIGHRIRNLSGWISISYYSSLMAVKELRVMQ